MSNPQILINGAGAVGLSQGYHLSTGASITYLVRPGRKPAYVAPKRLYDYKTNSLHIFDDYRVIESASEVNGESFFCVFDTLDGATARSENGAATLRSVGEVIRNDPKTFVVYDAAGLDMKSYYSSLLGIPQDRLLVGISMLAHQPTEQISLPAEAKADLAAQANLFYIQNPGKAGMALQKDSHGNAAAFKELYSKNGELTVSLIPSIDPELLFSLGIVVLMGWYVHGYGQMRGFVNNTELWNLTVRAQGEALALPRFGWTGYILSWIMGSWISAKMNSSMETQALPLSYPEFNAFHHGGKVVKQDIALLKELVEEGTKTGKTMEAMHELIKRVEGAQKKRSS
ncbi:hypothetical protein B9Z65_9016 [Elsinoe australis]|uniref:Ketopantoate reductase N-terminal domain-containing protein n=1 Tax=Elsinoe australis TaxID=40998 RepID=A0A2P8ABH4_9PEZI|nr:hypothetical protein B9Z65_9016 [Elsinoe australis]